MPDGSMPDGPMPDGPMSVRSARSTFVAERPMPTDRLRGWVVAVLLAALWSLLLVGIPTLYLLMRPATRRAFGVG